MEEKEWKNKRSNVLKVLRLASADISAIKDSGVLLKAEQDVCDIIEANLEIILGHWSERSIVSRLRFVKGVSDG